MSAENRDVARGVIAPHRENPLLRVHNSRLSLERPLVMLVCGPGPSVSQAAEPATIPTSFAEVAAAALAASFVIRVPAAAAPAEDGSIQSVLDADEEIQEDGHEPLDAAAELRNRTVGTGVIIDPRGIALTSTRGHAASPRVRGRHDGRDTGERDRRRPRPPQ